MKKYLYVLIAWMLPLCSIHAQAPVWNPDNGNGTFTNPIMWGDWPDPDVIRVGDDFYFVHKYALCSRLSHCHIERFGELEDGRICCRPIR